MSRHPGLEKLAAYAERKLPPAQEAKVREHLVTCDDCTEVVAATITSFEGLDEDEEGDDDGRE